MSVKVVTTAPLRLKFRPPDMGVGRNERSTLGDGIVQPQVGTGERGVACGELCA